MLSSCFHRHITSALLLVAALMWGSGTALAGQQLQILTSFPPLFYTPFIEQFEQLHPDISVSILNKKATAAIDEIARGNDRQFDIFWSSSVDAFGLLKDKKMLRRSQIIQDEPTLALKNMKLDDPDGFFYGFAISGIGWMWNNSYLNKEGIPIPQSWEDLQKSIYYGHLAMSTPSRSGTTHLIVENILQTYGWEEGWGHLTRMSGNFATITARSFGVPEGVASQRFGIGLVIDFLARTHENKDLGFLYSKPAFPVPAGIASLENSQNHAMADLFIRFILSAEGQKILLRPEINRLPIHRNLLLDRQDKVIKLLQLIEGKELQTYAINVSRQRFHLVNKLFDQIITFRLRERRQLWKRLIQIEKSYGSSNEEISKVKYEVMKQISQIPVSRQQSLDPRLNNMMSSEVLGQPIYDQQRETIAAWDQFLNHQFQQATELLDELARTLAAVKN